MKGYALGGVSMDELLDIIQEVVKKIITIGGGCVAMAREAIGEGTGYASERRGR